MKRLAFILSLLLPFCFTACSDDDEPAVIIIEEGSTIVLTQGGTTTQGETGDLNVEIEAGANSMTVGVSTNVTLKVNISVDWITQADTRGVSQQNLHFLIAENDTDADRQGIITISGGDAMQTIRVAQQKVPTEDKRTVLVYMAGDNSLRKFVSEDLEELKEGWMQMGSTLGKKLLAYVDDGSPRLIEIARQDTAVVETIVKEYEADRNSVGLSETKEVFRDVFNNSKYQAGSYGLVYWSHGDGWIPNPLPSTRWIGQDTGNGTHYMNIDAFVEALQTAPHFDFILFDACFMQSVEVAYELRSYTDYYIGNPAENPGPGAPYDAIIPYMFQKGAAAQIATAYFNYYNGKYDSGNGISNSNWTGGTAIGVLKSSELDNLAAATRTALSGVETDAETLRRTIFDYDQRSYYSSSYVGYYDLVELMETIVEDGSALNSWKQAFNAAQGYWSTTSMIYSAVGGMFSMERSHGVSHYIPSTEDAPRAAAAYQSTAWYNAAGLSELGW